MTRSASCTREYPTRKREGGGYDCCYCGKGPLPGRSTRYCSADCREEVWIRCNPGHARWRVKDRDRGVCAKCGLDTLALERLAHRASSFNWSWGGALWHVLHLAGVASSRWGCGHTWEANHIVPVSEGGGLCGLDNLETLCLRCHKAETGRQARERALARRELPLFDTADAGGSGS